MRSFSIILTLAGVLAGAGCQKAHDDRLEKKIDTMLTKMESMEKRMDQLAANRPAAGQAAAGAPRRPDPNTVYAVPVDPARDPIRGAKHAKVTIVEAFEFACPYCATLAKPMEDVLARHGSDVRIVSKQVIVHPQTATLPALGTCAARNQGKYAEYERELWARAWPMAGDKPQSPKMDATQLTQASLEKLAADLGLDVARFKADMASPECKGAIEKQQAEMRQIGVNGTPAIFVNGRPYVGPRTAEGLSQAVTEEIKKVDAVLAKGVKLEDYYSTIVQTGKKTL